MVIRRDRLSPGDRIIYHRKTGEIMFKRDGKPFVLSNLGSSKIFVGPNCIIDGLIKLFDELLRPSGLIIEIREHSEDTMELILHT